MQRSEKQDQVLYLLCSKIVSQHRQQTAITDTKANTICFQNLQKINSHCYSYSRGKSFPHFTHFPTSNSKKFSCNALDLGLKSLLKNVLDVFIQLPILHVTNTQSCYILLCKTGCLPFKDVILEFSRQKYNLRLLMDKKYTL